MDGNERDVGQKVLIPVDPGKLPTSKEGTTSPEDANAGDNAGPTLGGEPTPDLPVTIYSIIAVASIVGIVIAVVCMGRRRYSASHGMIISHFPHLVFYF